jgi:L-alanine-DL-glutamate epimerase-like enolase superfamily enzyme
MIIKNVRVIQMSAPWVNIPRFSPTFNNPRSIVAVEIETQSGIVGLGYLQLINGGADTVVACLKEMVVPHLLGRDASEVEGIWQDLWRANYWVGRMGITVMAQSAVDIALWDIVGKRANLPLHRLWGHVRSRIPAYGSGCWRGLGGDGMIEKAQAFVDAGFNAIKMQCGHVFTANQDAANVRAMRDALGPEAHIMIDINMGWRADEAILTGRKLQEYEPYWLEEPVDCEDFAGYLRIAEALDTRIVGGETHFTRFDMRPFFENPELPILQPDVMRGGLTELRKIAVLADTYNMTLAPHLFPELMVHLMASIPNGSWLEYMDWLDDCWVEPILPDADGHFTAPERPGHGLAFKDDFLAEYTVNKWEKRG